MGFSAKVKFIFITKTSPFMVYIQKEVPMLENLLEYYKKSDGVTKKKIPGCIFAEKLVLETRNEVTQFRSAEKGKLQPVVSLIPYNSSSGLVMFWEVPKKNKRSILTSCAVWYPERDLNLFYCI